MYWEITQKPNIYIKLYPPGYREGTHELILVHVLVHCFRSSSALIIQITNVYSLTVVFKGEQQTINRTGCQLVAACYVDLLNPTQTAMHNHVIRSNLSKADTHKSGFVLYTVFYNQGNTMYTCRFDLSTIGTKTLPALAK